MNSSGLNIVNFALLIDFFMNSSGLNIANFALLINYSILGGQVFLTLLTLHC